MTKPYKAGPFQRILNRVVRGMVRLGVGDPQIHLLTVRGRKSGRAYSTPVNLTEEGGTRWLVSPYGEVAWVRNARVSGEVTLTRRNKSETVGIEEVTGPEAAPILRSYLKATGMVQPYFDATPDSPLEAFEAEASRHPVFRIVDRGGG